MGFRFRKSLKIAPGVRVNLSRRGVSTSVGPKGATLNVSRRGARVTAQTGIPGLSYSTKLGGGSSTPPTEAPGHRLFDFRGVRGKVKIFNLLVTFPFILAYIAIHF